MSDVSINDTQNAIDIQARTLHNGEWLDAVRVFDRQNIMTNKLQFTECNGPTGLTHTGAVKTGLPSTNTNVIAAAKIVSSAGSQIFTESTFEKYSYFALNAEIAERSGKQAILLKEKELDASEALAQEVPSMIINGNGVTEPKGLKNRYSSLATSAVYAKNIISASSTGTALTSAYFITFGKNGVQGLTPGPNSNLYANAGFYRKPITKVEETDTANDTMTYNANLIGGVSRQVGFMLNDWRTCGRVCNIDMNSFASSSTAPDLFAEFFRIANRISRATSVNYSGLDTICFVNPSLYEALAIQMVKLANSSFVSPWTPRMMTYNDFLGGSKDMMTIANIPIMQEPTILEDTEARVTE